MGLTLIFGPVALAFLAMTGGALFHLRRAQRLPAWKPPTGEPAPLRCSVVIPARDEEARIEETLRRVLAQRGVDLELIAVDDRSHDRTGEIIRRVAEEDARVRYVRIESLPDGWLGKCHACHRGAATATGEWILFADADCWLPPDVIARALQAAAEADVEHITLTPGVAPKSLAAGACHLVFLMSLADWMSRVNRDRPRAYLGIGAFNLVRADVYRRCGGYEALRLTVVDDLKLGLLVRRAGARTRAFFGGDDACCEWGATVANLIAVLEKSYYAAMEFRLERALTAGVGGMLFWTAAVVGPFTGTAAGIIAGASLMTLAIPAMIVARRLGWSPLPALATPFVFPILLFAALNSTWKTHRQGGVRWRDTFYPLDQLRRGAISQTR